MSLPFKQTVQVDTKIFNREGLFKLVIAEPGFSLFWRPLDLARSFLHDNRFPLGEVPFNFQLTICWCWWGQFLYHYKLPGRWCHYSGFQCHRQKEYNLSILRRIVRHHSELKKAVDRERILVVRRILWLLILKMINYRQQIVCDP